MNAFRILAFFFLLVFVFVGGTIIGARHNKKAPPVALEQTKAPTPTKKPAVSKPIAEKKVQPKPEEKKAPAPVAKKAVEKQPVKSKEASFTSPFLNKNRTGHTVVVEVFRNERKAANRAKELKDETGLDVFYLKGTANDFLVCIGAFTYKDTASGFKKTLEAKNFSEKRFFIRKIY